VLAIYTDGLIERRGLNMDSAIDLFAGVLADHAGATPAQLVAAVGERLGDPDDDVALLVVGFDAEKTRFDVELASEPSVLSGMRHRLRAWLTRRGFDDDEASEILLAVSEACNNAIEHAYDGALGAVRVAAEAKAGWVEVVVEDRGRWRDVEPNEDRGRGMLLIRRLMDSAEFTSDHRGTRAVLGRRLPTGRPAGGEQVAAPIGS
jgi:anti-sigma regulatory factor (Ser/Thr protein kinase)